MLISEENVQKLKTLQGFLTVNLPPAEPKMNPSVVINFTKFTMFIFCSFLMLISQNFSIRAVLYTAVHGSYGFVWGFKQHYLPDAQFNQQVSFGSVLFYAFALLLYYLIPINTIFGDYQHEIEKGRIFVSLLFFGIGVFFMIGSDAQKFWTLKLKKGLINTEFYSITRSPNYFGEYLIYMSFLIICANWFIYIAIHIFWCTLFAMILIKDHSLYNKEGGKEYFEQSYVLFPKIFKEHQKNIILYAGLGLVFTIISHLG